ncbi:pimeloyl-CoA dehydrogenase large subunit, partial [Acinetobacter baumannii]|uniref:acyl-CoA dehydrogenase family protein n=1 Tax=Acinetobacter baumannii TaxID=470 RepID=UPI002412E35C
NLVGEENKGWTCAKYLLTFERTGIAGVGRSKASIERLKQVAREQKVDGKPLLEEPHFRARIADVEAELMALEVTNLRTVAAAEAGGVPGAESSFLKIMGTELYQDITELFRIAAGPYALPFVPAELEGGFEGPYIGPDFASWTSAHYFNFRKHSI